MTKILIIIQYKVMLTSLFHFLFDRKYEKIKNRCVLQKHIHKHKKNILNTRGFQNFVAFFHNI